MEEAEKTKRGLVISGTKQMIKIIAMIFMSLFIFKIVMSFLTHGETYIWKRPYMENLVRDSIPLILVSAIVGYIYSMIDYQSPSVDINL